MTTVKNKKVGNDPWGDGRTMEWALSSPPRYYNFKQLPLVKGIDTYWLENGGEKGINTGRTVRDIHMPNNSAILMMIALVVAAFGALYSPHNVVGDGKPWGIPVLVIGLVIAFGSMLLVH